MNKDIKIGSRYGHQHTLRHMPEEGDNIYRYEPAQDWMPIYCSFVTWDEKADINELISIDTDGGPCLNIGSSVSGKTVDRIYWKRDVGYLLELL